MDKQLTKIERQIWNERRRLFKEYYSGQPKREPYADGLLWGQLAAYDRVLSTFRGVIQGTSGNSGEQMETQCLRCGGERSNVFDVKSQEELDGMVKQLTDRGYKRHYTVIAPGGKRYRIMFADAKREIAIELGRGRPGRDEALRRLGWKVYRLDTIPANIV